MINLILNILQKSKALNIIILEKNSNFTEKNKVIISTGTSYVHINSISRNLIFFLKKKIKNIDYIKSGINTNWVLIEVNDIIINIMSKEIRHHYDLESLYSNLDKNDKIF